MADLQAALKNEKDIHRRYLIAGKLLAADPSLISAMLPDLLKSAGNWKAGRMYMKDITGPAYADCVPVLVKLLREKDQSMPYWAEELLEWQVGVSYPALMREIKEGTPASRTAAARAIGNGYSRGGGEKVLAAKPALISAIKDAEQDVRIAAAFSLIQLFGDKEKLGADTLVNEYPKLAEGKRRTLLQSVRHDGESLAAMRPLIAVALQDSVFEHQLIAARLAYQSGKFSVASFGKIFLTSLDRELDWQAQDNIYIVMALGEKLPGSLEALKKAEARTADASLKALLNMAILQRDRAELSKRLPVVVAELDKQYGYRKQRGLMIELIGNLGTAGGAAAPVLRAHMVDPREVHRYSMAIALAKISPPDRPAALQLLREGLAEKYRLGFDDTARWEDLSDVLVPLIPDLIKALESGKRRRVGLALNLLGGIGSSASSALPAIRKIDDKYHARRVERAIQRITKKSP